MASKKTSKKASKKTASKKGPARKKKPAGDRKKPRRKELGKGTVVFFMGSLIQAGYLGDGIPEALPEKNEAAKELRIMAERLARQVLRHGEGDAASMSVGDDIGEE